MFIRGKSNKRRYIKPVVEEVAPQEQPLDIAEVAIQKVEEVLTMEPIVKEIFAEEPLVEEEPAMAEEDDFAIIDQAIEFIEDAEEPVEPIGEAEPAEESIPDLLGEEEGE